MTLSSSRDRRAIHVATFAAGLLIGAQVGGKATRDTLFLSSFPASDLPKVMIAGAILSIGAVVITSRLLSRFGPARVVPGAMLASAALFGGEWVMATTVGYEALAAVVVYLHMSVFGAITISAFWSVVNERFDPHTAKRNIGRITAGSTFGGVVGGIAAERVGAHVDVPSMLLVLALVSTAGAVAVARVDRRQIRRSLLPEASPRSGLKLLRETRYLRHMAAVVALTSGCAAFLDFALKAEAADEFRDSPAELISFFAIFYTVTSLATFVLQTTLSHRILQRIGLFGTLVLLPMSVLTTGFATVLLPRLWTVTLLRGSESVLANSLFRSGYELLFTPLPPEKKRPTKTIIDVAFQRLGDALGSGLVLVVLAAVPFAPIQAVAVAAMLASVAGVWFVHRLDRGYITQLAASLRTGVVRLRDDDVVDATTKRTLAETTMALDREKLLAQIEELRRNEAAESGADLTPPPGAHRADVEDALERLQQEGAGAARTLTPEETREMIEDVLCGDDERVLRRLRRRPLDRPLVALVIPLVAHADLGRDAMRALRSVSGIATGQLVDALLDRTHPAAVRRRLPRVLRSCGSQRAADGLFAGLSDPSFEVRLQCGRALSHMRRKNAELSFDEAAVLEVARQDLVAGQRAIDGGVSSAHRGEPGTVDAAFMDGVLRRRVARHLDHVFAILGLVLDPEAIRLSLAAMKSEDANLRGTALEYLDNVLPEPVRKALWPYVGAELRVDRPRRSRREIVDEMLQSMESLRVDVAALGDVDDG